MNDAYRPKQTERSGKTVTPTASDNLPARNFLDALLTTDRAQRVRITHTLMASLIFAICIVLIVYAVSQGMINAQYGFILSVCMVATSIGYYVILRSGLNLRLGDPALTLPQILTALTWVCAAYGITNDMHGGTLMLYALVMVFGVFNMRQRSAYIASGFAIVSMGATMYYKTTTDPLHYPAHVEWAYFIFVVSIIPTIGQLSTQITHMRDRLRTQKNELVSQRSELLAQKVELEHAMERIRELATRDELTGLINRREMSEVIGNYVQMQQREATGFSMAMIDLDHFKRINDTWGHSVGDAVLRAFAQQTRLTLRETDTISRWGGEEFLVLLPNTGDGDPWRGIVRLLENMANLCICDEAPDLRVSFSAGIAQYFAGESIIEGIARADKALYQAKEEGRNRIVLAATPMPRGDSDTMITRQVKPLPASDEQKR